MVKVIHRTFSTYRLTSVWLVLLVLHLPYVMDASQGSNTRQKHSLAEKLSVETPKGWSFLVGGMGFDALIAGPSKQGKRVVIGITDLGIKFESFKDNIIDDLKSKYLTSRLKYIKEKSGEVIKASAPKLINSSKELSLYEMSVNYKIKSENFREVSYILGCQSGVFHIKAMTKDDKDKTFHSKVKKIVDSTSCINF